MGDRQELFDTDPASLERRVASVLRDGARLVGRFTLWYTTRPAVHGAVVEPGPERATTR
ncbi:MAG TPA: hypothetical protein VNZ62_09785 [Capillimicrobium sp.]|nr:hypothetical protein [Capillimicrobium sp.]